MKSHKTSCSDNDSYPLFCHDAGVDESKFRIFRQDTVYTSIVETLTREGGDQYLQFILKKDPSILDFVDQFITSDMIGNPFKYKYLIKRNFFTKKYITIAPTTLRYIKVLSDLRKFFGSLNDLRIVEIGAGYGGQCKIIADIFKFKSYVIFDIDPAIALTRKFLEHFQIPDAECRNVSGINRWENFDLCISNYAFSELCRSEQEKYIPIILNSTMGYFTCNFQTHTFEPEQFTAIDLMNMHNDSKVITDSGYLPQIDYVQKIDLIIWGKPENINAC